MKSTSPTLPYTNCIELIFRPNKWPADSAGVACPSAFSTAPNITNLPIADFPGTTPECNDNKFLGANHSRGSMVQFAQARYIYCHQTLPRPTTFPPPCLKNNNSKEEATPATPMQSTSPTLRYINCIEHHLHPQPPLAVDFQTKQMAFWFCRCCMVMEWSMMVIHYLGNHLRITRISLNKSMFLKTCVELSFSWQLWLSGPDHDENVLLEPNLY